MLNFFSHTYSSNFSFFSGQSQVHSPSKSKSNGTSNDPTTRTPTFGGTKVTFIQSSVLFTLSLQIMKALTSNILDTFKKCNPQFFYNPTANPKRCLTYPPEGNQ